MTSSTDSVLRTEGLGKKYRRHLARGEWALSDCSLDVPAGRVVGLVGPNGAGKSTLLNLSVGLLAPSAGSVEVLGTTPGRDSGLMARVGYVAQDTPTYSGLTVEEHLRLGARLNPTWDDALARERIGMIGLDPKRKAGRLSGGQRAQLALTLGVAKRPELLILDEPVASLDPLARREFLQDLMETVAEQELSVILSSHVVSDLERTCDYVIVLIDSKVRVSDDVETLLATHKRLVGPQRDAASLPADLHVIHESHTDRQSTFIVRADGPVLDPAWAVSALTLEDVILAYMSQASGRRAKHPQQRPVLEVQR